MEACPSGGASGPQAQPQPQSSELTGARCVFQTGHQHKVRPPTPGPSSWSRRGCVAWGCPSQWGRAGVLDGVGAAGQDSLSAPGTCGHHVCNPAHAITA